MPLTLSDAMNGYQTPPDRVEPKDRQPVTMADTSGWPPYLKQPDPEHLDRLGLMETQIGGTHYLGKPMQPWDIIEAWDLDFFEGSVLKYLLRRKPGNPRVMDLKKAAHYLEKCIAREEARTGR